MKRPAFCAGRERAVNAGCGIFAKYCYFAGAIKNDLASECQSILHRYYQSQFMSHKKMR